MQPSVNERLAAYLQQQRLPPGLLDLLGWFYLPLADHIAGLHRSKRPLLLGINGAQGSGKTTLAGIICLLLQQQHGLRCASLSLDDLYLTKAEREVLAQDIHPLFITRGVPGTHDMQLGNGILDQVEAGQPVVLPRFDKLTDDRVPAEQWTEHAPLDVLILEGWCVGCRPQEDIREPVNALETDEDQDGRWRQHVNSCLQSEYAELFSRLHALLMLAVPSMEKVYQWRELQEKKLERKHGSRGMSAEEVRRFIMHYERLTRWMLQEMPQRADILIPIGAEHAPTELKLK
jgi:D-glycerate 3-kinase